VSTSPATAFATRLLGGLIEHGLTDLVIAPGSRSQALALAALEFEKQGALRVHVRIDERAGAFLALGIALETNRAVAIVTTSGTAVANLHPAILEANHAGVPLIALTADRPVELRGIGSNQTTRQPDIFGSAVRLSVDVPAPVDPESALAATTLAADAWQSAMGATDGIGAGPVQLNLAFREPLSGASDGEVSAVVPGSAAGNGVGEAARPAFVLDRAKRTLVIAGSGAGPAAEELAHQGGWPLIAEIASASRYGRNLVPAYREVLRQSELTDALERVVVFGHPTLSREIPALLAGREGLEIVIVRSRAGEVFNPGHRASHIADAVEVPAGDIDTAWLGTWMRAGHAAHDAWLARYEAANPAAIAPNVDLSRSTDINDMREFANAELAAAKSPVTRELLVDAVWRSSWPHDRLLFGASRLVRVADRTLGGKKIPVFSNRGLAGIDGTISTGVGIALASGAHTRVLLGDLAALHDAGGMLIGSLESRPRIQVIVGNDGGGSLFDSLELAQSADAGALDRAFFTPHEVDFAALATAYGWEHVRVQTASELERALTQPADGPQLVEVLLSR